jgi:transposase InsO family protein
MRSDNGSCQVSREFRGVLEEHHLGHQRIKPHCPEDNGVIKRSNRTLREALDGQEFSYGRPILDVPIFPLIESLLCAQ